MRSKSQFIPKMHWWGNRTALNGLIACRVKALAGTKELALGMGSEQLRAET